MAKRNLIIGGITVPLHAVLEGIQQTYDPLQARSRGRLADGSLQQRTTWSGKVATSIRGRGVIPAGLQGLDYTQPLVISCVAHRAITSAGRVITLPAARRSDAGSLPYGRAEVMRGNTPQWVDTGIDVVDDVATLTEVPGAVRYQAVYFPEITVFADPPAESKDGHGTVFGWQITAEEK